MECEEIDYSELYDIDRSFRDRMRELFVAAIRQWREDVKTHGA